MALLLILQALLFLVGAVCWAEIVDVRAGLSRSAESAALVRREPFQAQAGYVTGERRPSVTRDFELLDIVLVASVDGKFHAFTRKEGRPLWSMSSFARAASPATPTSLAPLVRTVHADHDEDDMGPSETYIVEPQTGDIYVANHEEGSLQRFPFSVPELVDMSPFTSPGDEENRVFIGSKKTSLLLLELETGKIKATLDSECPPYEDNRDEMDGFGEEENSGRPATTEVFIGRTDYTISIRKHSKRYGRLTQDLSFSVYGPNNEDNVLQASYRRSNDDTYIQGFPNGDIFSFSTKSDDGRVESKPLWSQRFNTPVVAVFDVLKGSTPLQNHPHAFVLLQPRPRAEDIIPHVERNNLPNRFAAYVGMVEQTGSLFVLSPTHYPLVAFDTEYSNPRAIDGPNTPQNMLARKREEERQLICEENPHDRHCLLGMLRLDETDGHESRMRRLLEGPQSADTLPTSRPIQQWIDHGIPPPQIDALPNNSQSATTVNAEEVRKSGWEIAGVTICLGLFSLWLLFKKFGQRESFKFIQPAAPLIGQPSISTPIETPNGSAQSRPESLAAKVVPETPAPVLPLPDSAPGHSEDSAAETSHPTGEDGEDTDRDGEGDPGAPGTPTPKKKTRRGKRGKKKKKDASAPPEEDEANSGDGPAKSLPNGNHASPALAPPQVSSSLSLPPLPPTPSAAPSLSVSETILGFGSHGTVVFQGSLQGRAVAVKRLLKDFVTLASREVSILQESDDHPNVIRYYYQEAHANFLYIALELCPASLADIVETPDREAFRDIAISFDPKKALQQITSGLRHLHALKLVHRDIKPQNILISTNKSNGRGRPTYRMLISDFGLCKKLDMDQTSFLPTVNGGLGAGTVGWRAPEILRGEVKLDDLNDDHSMSSRGSVSTVQSIGSNSSSPSTAKPTRLTKSVDIFALGCLYYYTLTNGNHPYGDRFEREVNILKDQKSLDLLERFGEEGTEACDLIDQMLHPEASERPDTTACLIHPFFWDASRRLNFLQEASDRFEIMCREPKDPNLVELEKDGILVVGNDWASRLDKVFIENLGKFRKYDGKSVQDLLRSIRNKKHHYQDLPDNVKRTLGPLPEGYLGYFTKRYPRLFLHVHRVIKETGLRTDSMFRSYFELPDYN
ncbi:hypothetical protein FA15DRAFT_664103 [Coprinopsis marcescibilis]|uniref:non-specific serine/threonine protein kinase n=1 Tax=Coprinopsis marcescibilis TaxID=230819 RepID=A0A5C3LA99_COPMA|nr:hypothetical protein FA15DRAFT_664103 [Coprinopsis marcescibilis]